jgi:hypothetical protein|uniref:hypothetical protein n=1 Tax=Cephaloticoccus sp. TaxID=1985742 RepID=UPI00404A130A
MNAEIQTLLSLAVVAIASVWLVRRAFRKKSGGCASSECGAISPEVKKLQAKLRH